MQRPTVICLTPVKNEAWTLERFLKCASTWADRIIIADQGSTDGSREIAKRFPKVSIIDNASREFNEPERQKMLLAEARRIPGPKVLLALDADEFLTANLLASPEWESILTARPGTVIKFQWPLIQCNDSELSFFYFNGQQPIGFVDDGSEHHEGKAIHNHRIPTPSGAPIIIPTEIKLMHYCLFDPNRFKSKIRWYQCFEHLVLKKRAIDLYRFYHIVLSVPSKVIKPVPKEWIRGYEELGIDMSSVNQEGSYYWDKEVLRYFEKHGTSEFRRLAIFDVDWNRIHKECYSQVSSISLADPRNRFERLVHRWLVHTQPYFSFYARPRISQKIFAKCVHKVLRLLGW
jgi:glycosyltransferase involved in cell wall biosynthesis